MRQFITCLSLALAVVTASACAHQSTTSDARETYIKSVSAKLDGNNHEYYRGLIKLAHNDPETRAGRRARATLAGNDLATYAFAMALWTVVSGSSSLIRSIVQASYIETKSDELAEQPSL